MLQPQLSPRRVLTAREERCSCSSRRLVLSPPLCGTVRCGYGGHLSFPACRGSRCTWRPRVKFIGRGGGSRDEVKHHYSEFQIQRDCSQERVLRSTPTASSDGSSCFVRRPHKTHIPNSSSTIHPGRRCTAPHSRPGNHPDARGQRCSEGRAEWGNPRTDLLLLFPGKSFLSHSRVNIVLTLHRSRDLRLSFGVECDRLLLYTNTSEPGGTLQQFRPPLPCMTPAYDFKKLKETQSLFKEREIGEETTL
ncbi:hypothetical protein GN956_G5945 [Arapaima gigas]